MIKFIRLSEGQARSFMPMNFSMLKTVLYSLPEDAFLAQSSP